MKILALQYLRYINYSINNYFIIQKKIEITFVRVIKNFSSYPHYAKNVKLN